MEDHSNEVVITKEQLEWYQEYERWVQYYVSTNGKPCRSFTKRFPKFDPWHREHTELLKRQKEEGRLNDKLEEVLTDLKQRIPEFEISTESIKQVLLSATPNQYKTLRPTPLEIDEEDEDEEDEDEEDDWDL